MRVSSTLWFFCNYPNAQAQGRLQPIWGMNFKIDMDSFHSMHHLKRRLAPHKWESPVMANFGHWVCAWACAMTKLEQETQNETTSEEFMCIEETSVSFDLRNLYLQFIFRIDSNDSVICVQRYVLYNVWKNSQNMDVYFEFVHCAISYKIGQNGASSSYLPLGVAYSQTVFLNCSQPEWRDNSQC